MLQRITYGILWMILTNTSCNTIWYTKELRLQPLLKKKRHFWLPWLTVLLHEFEAISFLPIWNWVPSWNNSQKTLPEEPLKPGCWYARLPVTHALANDDDEKIKQGHLGRGPKKPLLTCYLVRVRRLWWWQRQPNDGPIKWLLLNLFNLFAHLIWLVVLCMENSKMSTKALHFFC